MPTNRTLTPDESAALIDAEAGKRGNKYAAQRCWSELCQRYFDSKAERERGEYLHMALAAGAIEELEYQPIWVLSDKPKITYKADFAYWSVEDGYVIEDVKGILTRETRVKLAWLKEKFGVEVKIIK